MSQEDGHQAPFALPASLDVAAAPALASALRQYAETAENILLDASAIARVSTPCVQILLAAALDAQARGMSFRFVPPCPILTSAIAELGLTSAFAQ